MKITLKLSNFLRHSGEQWNQGLGKGEVGSCSVGAGFLCGRMSDSGDHDVGKRYFIPPDHAL